MRLLVCGNRNWTCAATIEAWMRPLSYLAQRRGEELVVIHGAATGADIIAGEIAKRQGLRVEEYPADWERWGRSAGYRRNVQMAETGIDRGLAFGQLAGPDGKRMGTGGMVSILNAEGVLVTVVPRPGVRP